MVTPCLEVGRPIANRNNSDLYFHFKTKEDAENSANKKARLKEQRQHKEKGTLQIKWIILALIRMGS